MEKWLILFFIFLAFAIGMYFINQQIYINEEKQQAETQKAIYENQEYIITKIDNLSEQRAEENLKQTKILLDNISHLVYDNGELIKEIIKDQNITIDFQDGQHPNATGTISGIGKPVIIR